MMLTPDDVVVLSALTTESLDAVITSSVDPTGTPPEFALVDGDPDDSTVFAAGEWVGSWAAGTIGASTPLFGKEAEPGFELIAGKRYRVWVRFSAGGETPVQPVGSIRVLGTLAGALPPLATLNDLEARLGTTIADPVRAAAVLADVSASVRAECGQTISRTTSTVRLVPNREGWVRLPQHPVVSVVGHTVDDFGRIATWQAGDFTYTHGWDPVPPLVIGLVCQIAGRALATPSTSAGVQSETLGAYSYSIGAAAAAGPFGVLESELRAIKRLRRPSPPISTLPTPQPAWPACF